MRSGIDRSRSAFTAVEASAHAQPHQDQAIPRHSPVASKQV